MNKPGDTLIDLRGVGRVFGEAAAQVTALRDVSLTIRRGEFVAIMGPSGCGKSTLLHIIGGLDCPTSGTVAFESRELAGMSDDDLTVLRRQKVGFVFQAFNLIGVLSTLENVAIPLILDGVSHGDATRRASDALARVGLSERREHMPAELSGGEQQRVALARALVNNPIVLLADEPTGNLDSTSGDAVLALMRRLVDDGKQTIVMVTHSARHAAMADRVVTMRDGAIHGDNAIAGGRTPRQVLAELESLT